MGYDRKIVSDILVSSASISAEIRMASTDSSFSLLEQGVPQLEEPSGVVGQGIPRRRLVSIANAVEGRTAEVCIIIGPVIRNSQKMARHCGNDMIDF